MSLYIIHILLKTHNLAVIPAKAGIQKLDSVSSTE